MSCNELSSCGYIFNRQGYFYQRSFVLCFIVPSPYYLSGVLSSTEFSFRKGESLNSKQEVTRGHKSNPSSDNWSSIKGVLWTYWCQFCYIYYHSFNAVKKKSLSFFFWEQATASLLVQTLLLLSLLILLFNTYPYLFKKALNLGSHEFSWLVYV